jgi:hypothetical protein
MVKIPALAQVTSNAKLQFQVENMRNNREIIKYIFGYTAIFFYRILNSLVYLPIIRNNFCITCYSRPNFKVFFLKISHGKVVDAGGRGII